MKAGLAAVLLIPLSLGTAQVNYCPNFEMPVLGKDLIYQEFRKGVLRITSGDAVGTGYLIDSEQGYVITAAHVVQPSLHNPAVEISATNEKNADSLENTSSGKKPFKLKAIADLRSQDLDIALLQLMPPNTLEGTTALDIALRIPLSSRESYVFGYAREQLELSQQRAESTNGNRDGTLTVKQAAFPGDSGSPLIDETGKVVATCIERVVTQEKHVSNEAIYVPTAAILELLDKIPLNSRVARIEKDLRTKDISREDLAELLLPLPDKEHLSNLDLYLLAYRLWKDPSTKIQAHAFPCPILRALVQRKLEEAEERFQRYSDAKTRAAALLSLGQTAEIFKNPQKAAEIYATANDLLSKLSAQPTDVEAQGLRVVSLERLGSVELQLGEASKGKLHLQAAEDLSNKFQWEHEVPGQQRRESRLEGRIVRSNRDQSTLTVLARDTESEKTVNYDSSTKWTSQYHSNEKVNAIDAGDFKDGDQVICLGSYDDKKEFHATMCSKRLSHERF